MAKSENQKLKLLYILKILYEESDELHPISTASLIEKLGKYDIQAERKSIYSDMDALNQFGYNVFFNANKKSGGYYLVDREFELAELKMLVDMVQSSRFLTQKKSRELIKKLESKSSIYEARELSRAVYVTNRVKSENETVYYSVDALHHAINSNKSVTFQYFEYTLDKVLSPKRNGELYHVSPYYLIWANENYYLVGADERTGIIKHYRVDRMKYIQETEDNRKYEELFDKFDISLYSKSVFSMYSGEEYKVTIKCQNSLIGVVIDRFGKDALIRKDDADHFTVTATVSCSNQFYGWLAGLGTQAVIVSPGSIKEEFHDYIGRIYRLSDLK